MAKCAKLNAQRCLSLFECKQQHFEFEIIDWNSDNDSGETIHAFCINSMTSNQRSLLLQLLLSVSDVNADAFPFLDNLDVNDKAGETFGVPRQNRDSQKSRSADRLKVEALAETPDHVFDVACV